MPLARRTVGLLPLLLVTLGPAGRAVAQEKKDDKKDDRPTERLLGTKSRVFDVKYRSPDDLAHVLRPLGSGVRGTSIAESGEFRTITVRDFPENIADMEAALKRLDLPNIPKPDVELRARVVLASPAGTSQYPKELESVVRQLRNTLAYKSYSQVSEVVARVRAGAGASGKGAVQVSPPVLPADATTVSYSYGFEAVTIMPAAPGNARAQFRVGKLIFWIGNKAFGEAEIKSAITLSEGETVVVATQPAKERAMVLVLSARVVK